MFAGVRYICCELECFLEKWGVSYFFSLHSYLLSTIGACALSFVFRRGYEELSSHFARDSYKCCLHCFVTVGHVRLET